MKYAYLLRTQAREIRLKILAGKADCQPLNFRNAALKRRGVMSETGGRHLFPNGGSEYIYPLSAKEVQQKTVRVLDIHLVFILRVYFI